jgi:hypothetical protein
MRLLQVMSAAAALSFAVATAACTVPTVSVEVLPARTSITCAAPTVNDAASSRGLLDLDGANAAHGSYVADLRLSVQGVDARVDGVSVKYDVKGGSLGDFDGDVVGGDVVLDGDDDESRRAVLLNAQLLSREAAVSLRDDSDVKADETEFATLTITLTPVVKDEGIAADESTFALDLCRGCLVAEPACPVGFAAVQAPVCRAGQDQESFTCVAVGGGA